MLLLTLLVLMVVAYGEAAGMTPATRTIHGGNSSHFSLTSSAFRPGHTIPVRYTCDGKGLSPPLRWQRTPRHTTVFALIVDDPDAPSGVFTHWLLFNLPSHVQSLPAGVPRTAHLKQGGMQGRNDFGKIGYGPPCPPPGKLHHYRFTLYALDHTLRLNPGASRSQVIAALHDGLLAQARLIGTYRRRA
jgi:Raf kinase inhibitor-like YbhB/YbcL family protein